MALTERENWLRTANMRGGEWIPARVVISDAAWRTYREELEDVVARHPRLFRDFRPGSMDFDRPFRGGRGPQPGRPWRDNWGCVWEAEVHGIQGVVVGHPLADWDALDHFSAPDPLRETDRETISWEGRRQAVRRARESGRLAQGHLGHGFFFMRLYYLRGFENVMLDMASGDPRLRRLIQIVERYHRCVVDRWLRCGIDAMKMGEDLGTRQASFMGPRLFEEWVAPTYRRLMRPIREAGAHVYLHSDGYIMDIMENLIGCGVTVVNPQDLVNGIDALAEQVKGRVCIDLDIDRQSVVPFGTPTEIRDLIEREVRTLGSPQGGLMLTCGIYPPTPPENVHAVCSAIEEFMTWWRD